MAVATAQQPDALSLSGNLKYFSLQSNAAVDFVLKTGNQVILEETYYPGNGNMIRISLGEVIGKYLSVAIPAGNDGIQTGAARSFTAEYDGTAYSFVAVLCGVDNLKDTPDNFLRNNFLTWQPQVKEITYYSPEYITFYAPVACTLKLRAYFENSTETLTLYSASAGAVHTVNMQYAVIAQKLNNRYPGAYDVWTEDGAGKQMSYTQRYVATPARSRVENWYVFVNSLGGIDCMRAYGSDSYEPSYEHNLAEINGESVEYRVDVDRLHTRNTGRLTKDEAAWLQDFFVSRQRYHHTPTALRKIVLTESDAGISTSELPGDYSFTYKYADETPYLNLTRVKLPTNLSVPAPNTDDLFFLPPRLAEFPKHAIDRDLLILSNDPHDDTWSAIVVGELSDSILNSLIEQLEGIDMNPRGSGGGGSDIYIVKLNDLTPPTDLNVFSSLRTLYEIERATGDLDDRFLRKDVNDTAHGVISFDKEIRSTKFIDGFDGGLGWTITETGNAWMGVMRVRDYGIIGKRLGSEIFVSGFPNGLGWDISSYEKENAAEVIETKWRLEIDDIIVRGKLRVFEFIISQLRGENDNVIFAGMMKVDHYDPETGRLYLQTDEGILYNPFRSGDILMMQRFGGLPSEGNNYNVIKQYEMRVTEAYVGDLTAGKERLDYITFSNFVGDLEDVAEGDVMVRVDSVSDSTRKGIVKITTIDEVGAPNIDVIYGMKTDPMNATKARMGNLAGIRTKNNIDLTGVWGIYGNGAVFENSQIYLDNGMTIEQNFTVMNGQFTSEINALKDQISAESGNILQNPLFNESLYYWDIIADVSMFRTNVGLLWLNREFYADKRRAAEIYRDGSRYVLRLKKTQIRQNNKYFQFPEGIEKEGAYSFSFFYRALTGGILKAGVPGTLLYTEINLSPQDTYTKFSIMDEWDGVGDFVFETTGSVLIHSASLFNDALANAVVKLQTQITQNAEEIALRATKQYVDSQDGTIYGYVNSEISITAGQISIVSTKVDNINKTIQEAGWINTYQGNLIYARRDNVISVIEQTPESILISASRINLRGAITTSALASDVTTLINSKASQSDLSGYIPQGQIESAMRSEGLIVGGYMKMSLIDTNSIYANQAYIGNFSISNGWLKANANTGSDVGYIDMRGTNTRIAFGRDLIPGTAGGAFTCTAVIVNQNNSSYQYDSQKVYGLTIRTSGGVRNSDGYTYSEPVALMATGGISFKGCYSAVKKTYPLNYFTEANNASMLLYYNTFVFQPTTSANAYLPTTSSIINTLGYFGDGMDTSHRGYIEITILVTRWATSFVRLQTGGSSTPFIDKNGGTVDYIDLNKGNVLKVAHHNGAWYVVSSNF